MIKVLEVNNIDLPGKSFNGYDMIKELSNKDFCIKQAVIIKQSDNENVIKLFDEYTEDKAAALKKLEDEISVHNLISINGELLEDLKEYKDADIIHFHMFHNTNLPIPCLKKISRKKHVVITIHDPWFITGRCVHFYGCNKWQYGCENCEYLDNLFPLKEDNCNKLWKIKKEVFNNSNIDLIVSSQWMQNCVNLSPITNKQNVYVIPFGVDLNKFKDNKNKEKVRKKYNIKKDNIVFFLRAQEEFKGTKYVLEALKKINTEQKITILTCNEVGLLDDVKNKYQIIDLGYIKEDEVIDAMNACDIFLMTSKAESFGMMAVEAMACSRPVIIFDNTAMPSVTFAPDCGYLVEDKNSTELASAMLDLIKNKNERERRGKLGRELCEKYYSKESYNAKIQNTYREILNHNLTEKNRLSINKNKVKKAFLNINNSLKENTYTDIDIFDLNIDEINKLNNMLYKSFRPSLAHRIKLILTNHIKNKRKD